MGRRLSASSVQKCYRSSGANSSYNEYSKSCL